MKDEVSICIVGIGGQGIVFATSILAQTLFEQGYYVSQLQSYGAEVRGGAVIGWVVYSNKPIECPFIDEFDVLIVLHQSGYRECLKRNIKGRTIIVDEDLVPEPPPNAKKLPMNREVEKRNLRGLTNMVALGVLSALGYIDYKVLREVVLRRKGGEMNVKALEVGLNIMKK